MKRETSSCRTEFGAVVREISAIANEVLYTLTKLLHNAQDADWDHFQESMELGPSTRFKAEKALRVIILILFCSCPSAVTPHFCACVCIF